MTKEQKPNNKLPIFEVDDWGSSDTISSKWEYAYLGIDIVAGKPKIRIGELSIPIDELQEFIEWIQEWPGLIHTIKTNKPSHGPKINSADLAIELENALPKIRSIFERDDMFYTKLKKK